tara:strand:+ start:1092 stop:1736 length:645 start_codon:yes stop_codon:yes gene_type:complete
MSNPKMFPIRPLPRHSIMPLPREISHNFTPTMFNNSKTKIFILNPVFNVVLDEEIKQEETDICVICLENIIPSQKIKPCEICNTFMHEKCFVKYCRTIQTDPLCTTCYKDISLDELHVDIRNEIQNNSNNNNNENDNNENDNNETNRQQRILNRTLSNEEREFRNRKIRKNIYCCCFIILIVFVLILVIYAMHEDSDVSRRTRYQEDDENYFRP